MGTGKLGYEDWEVRVWGLGNQGIGNGKSGYRDWEVRV